MASILQGVKFLTDIEDAEGHIVVKGEDGAEIKFCNY